MNYPICWLCAVFLSATSVGVTAHNDPTPPLVVEPSTVLLESSQLPQPITRLAPKYPPGMARKGAEGWVQVNFVVGKQGNVKEVVINDSSGIDGFEREAIRAIKKWKYTPAFVDGQPVEQCHNQVQMDFKLHESKRAVRRKFRSLYIKATDALADGDIQLGSQLTQQLFDNTLLNGMESAWYSLLSADLAKAQNDELKELASVNRALSTDPRGEYVGKAIYQHTLSRQFILQVKRAKYVQALDTFMRIETQPDNQHNIDLLAPYAAKVRDLLKTKQIIAVPGQINDKGDWWHQLSRSAFSLSEVNGQLNTVELRCNNKRELYSMATDSVWTIPPSWGRCSVRIVGESESQFTLLERLPNV